MERTGTEDAVHLTVLFRDKSMPICMQKQCSVRELGEELVQRTGVVPHTMRLILLSSKRTSAEALSPFAERFSSSSLEQTGVHEGQVLRMMGALAHEIDDMARLSSRERILGFEEEYERARSRSTHGRTDLPLPRGPYIFIEFRALSLPQIELSPPASSALNIMHRLSRDPGIVAVMNKHRWTVQVMTEMAPVGYVGISPKCLLGFNKNRGEEISLRLRTDDLKGFRKYESIKKTLLHELAHMVHDEHDESFHSLDKQLNEEAMVLDWTRSRGRSWGGLNSYEPEFIDSGGIQGRQSYVLGGKISATPSKAAAEAALLRFQALGPEVVCGNRRVEERVGLMDVDKQVMYEEDSDVLVEGLSRGSQPPILGVSEGTWCEEVARSGIYTTILKKQTNEEPDPDDEGIMTAHVHSQLDLNKAPGDSYEPDPDDTVEQRRSEPDPDDIPLIPANQQVDYKSCSAAAGNHPEPVANQILWNNSTQHHQSTSSPEAHTAAELGQLPVVGDRDKKINDLDSLELRQIQKTTMIANVRLQEAIEKFMKQAGPSKAAVTAQTLSKILRNVCEHPNDTKFRRLRKENPTFMHLVGQYEGAVDFLMTVGFREVDEPGVLVLKRDDPGLLWLARSSLNAACSA